METRALQLIAVLAFLSPGAWSQLVIKSASTIATTNSTIAAQCNLINNSINTDLSQASIWTTGQFQLLHTITPLVLRQLHIEGGDNKHLEGEWEVTDVIELVEGLVVPSTYAIPGKIKFSGSEQPSGSINSYVNGLFFSAGTGERMFPVGNEAGYFPAVLPNVTETGVEIGLKVVEESSQLHLQAINGQEFQFLPSRYWSLVSATPVFPSTNIGLSINDVSFPSLRTAAVAGGAQVGDLATNLGRELLSNEFVISREPILTIDGIYTIAIEPEIRMVIHNMITPSATNTDSRLQIDNIEHFPGNVVTLVDRWGGIVHSWSSFTNSDSSFDFATLSPGNYVCIVEYTDSFGKSQVSQMITILK